MYDLQLNDTAITVSHGDARHLVVHVVLGLNQLASVHLKNIMKYFNLTNNLHLSSGSLNSDNVALSLVDDLDGGDSNDKHVDNVFVQLFQQLGP